MSTAEHDDSEDEMTLEALEARRDELRRRMVLAGCDPDQEMHSSLDALIEAAKAAKEGQE